MELKILCVFLILGLYAGPCFSQHDSIQYLEEVILSDVHLVEDSRGVEVKVLEDSLDTSTGLSLGALLGSKTSLYFKENGRGMVSSVSFRGTTAAQTAVVWNGINVNSAFTGQTDFNSILVSPYDNVSVRPGGGSVLYGSGAIGGSVHLNNVLRFRGGWNAEAWASYGSFATRSGGFNSAYATTAKSFKVGLNVIQSDNDYLYPGTDIRNSNGDFTNLNLHAASGWQLGEQHSLHWHSNFSSGSRGLSGTLFSPSKSEYQNKDSWNLLEWRYRIKPWVSSLKLAYLDESYQFYENRENRHYDFGHSKTGIALYELKHVFKNNLSLSGIAEGRIVNARGSNVGSEKLQRASLGILFSHELESLSYEASVRKEVGVRFDSPLLFSLGGKLRMAPTYVLQMNFSRNYRAPTLNDLFWYSGGNMHLKPEKSLQVSLGHLFEFDSLDFSVSSYLIKIDNLLRWVPDASGLWKPQNTDETRNFGAEVNTQWTGAFAGNLLRIHASYAFTKTKDLVLEKSLTYTPEHKASLTAAYRLGKYSLGYQFNYTGSVFTSSDNAYELPGYSLSDFSVRRSFFRNRLILELELQNIWNQYYESMPSRPMPGRSYQFSLIYTIKS